MITLFNCMYLSKLWNSLFFQDKVGEVLKRCGVQVLCKDLSLIAAFGAGAIIPIPALRALSFQAALVFAFNSLAMLTLFPALLGIDLKRLSANRLDLFCCKKGQNSEDKINQIPGNPDIQKESCQKWTLRYFVTNYWSVWIKKTPIKFLTLILASFLTCCGLYGIAHIKQGKWSFFIFMWILWWVQSFLFLAQIKANFMGIKIMYNS